MCTVSVVPLEDGFRVRCNRDERRERVEALPPRWTAAGPGAALFPEDPESGGTWVGVNDRGLAVALLNRTAGRGRVPRQRPRQSRGLIVPRILAEGSLEHAITSTTALDASEFDPFRLVLVHGGRAALVTSDGCHLAVARSRLSHPMMVTSSSLGDAFVHRPRRRLFSRLLAEKATWLDGQRRFHQHQWPRRPEVSVRMERADARTVSHTAIDVRGGRVALAYVPLPQLRRNGP